MGAVDIASVASRVLGDSTELTVFALCTFEGLRLVPRLGVGLAELVGRTIVYDPSAPLREQCDGILLALCRALLPTASESDVLGLADLLNVRLCQPP